MYSLGHKTPTLHAIVSCLAPVQSLPPCCGAGSVHVRVLTRDGKPGTSGESQVAEHKPHADQSVNFPST